MVAEQLRSPEVLEGVRRRRRDVHRALVELEQRIAAPVGGDEAEWLTAVFGALVDLRGAFDEHVVATEGPDGLFAEVVRAQPRLAAAVRRLADEHVAIRAAVDDLLGAVHHLADRERAAQVREQILALLLSLSRHRQAGADLVYEAYAVDIGGSG